MAVVKDKVGNYIMSEKQIPFGNLRIMIYIKRQKPRILGYINPNQRTFYAGEKQVTVKANGTTYFRFCKIMIQRATLFDRVCVKKQKGFTEKYCMSRQWLLDNSLTFGRVDDTFSDNIFINIKLVKEHCNGR